MINLVNEFHKNKFLVSKGIVGIILIILSLGCSNESHQSKSELTPFQTQPTVQKLASSFAQEKEARPTPHLEATASPTTKYITPKPGNNSPSIKSPPTINHLQNAMNAPLSGKKGGTLKLASKDYFQSLDPHQNYSAAYSTWGIGIIYQRLLKFSSGPNISLPSKATECEICKSWEMLDSKTFMFEIDTENIWKTSSSNLSNISAEDVKFSLDRQIQMESQNSNRFHMMHSVEIKPENHIQINLHAPDADLFIALADGRSKLLSKSNVENSQFIDPANLAGSGPWKLSKLKDSYSSVENTYSAPNIPYLDAIEFHILPDSQTRLSAYSVGLIDVYNIDDPSSNVDITFIEPNPGQGFEIAFNTGIPPFNDDHLRSLARATIDPDEIIQQAWSGNAFFSLGFSTNDASWIPEDSIWKSHFFPSKKREHLNKTIPINITASHFGPQFTKSVEIVADQLELIGFDPLINYVNRREYTKVTWNQDDFHALMGPTFPHSSTNGYVIPVLHSKGLWNTTNHVDVKLDELIEAQSQEYFSLKRSKIIKEINAHLLEKSYRFMPATQENLWAWTQDLKNMYPNFSGFEYTHWEKVWLDR